LSVDESFYALTPERVLSAVEGEGRRATGWVFALNSLENRVYEVELEDERRVVAKFYRPGRWSRAAILDEHAFLAELDEAEVPVVRPIDLGGGATLGQLDDGIFYAVFPKVRGRAPDELDNGQLDQLGRLVARLHNVGARQIAAHRPALTPESYGTASLAVLLGGPFVPLELERRLRQAGEAIVAAATAAFVGVEAIRLHGDCHLGNLLWGSTGPFFLDFDDFLAGPPVQDLWLLAPGHDAEARQQRARLVAAYESMRRFERSSLRLVEPLRALRILRYAAWIAARWRDPAFQRAFPDFEEHTFWTREVADLEEQRARVEAALAMPFT
jgi:Ser/Thr protein kinase RdoA (MazF antagonist)